MSRDVEGGPVRRPRVLARARVGWPRPLRELKDLVYEVYLSAGAPSLDEMAEAIGEDDTLVGAPSRDSVRRCISDPSLPPSQADLVSIAVVLARVARWGEEDLAARVRGLWVKARMATGAGRPVDGFEDALVLADLEVHPALDADGARDRLGVLPAYVPREFDGQVGSVVEAAAAGQSGVVVLVGGSSTGKTRAMWEAVRDLPEPWRLWHPLAPTRPDAALAELADVAPYTVIWLNEAQFYLAPEPLGERVAAGLRELLRDPARGPVLVMATLWPEHWQTLTTRTGNDRHAQARELLNGHRIDVPETFTPHDLVTLAGAAGTDPRLGEAAERAQSHQVTQYLAGVLALMNRYLAARGATRALVHAAMDARRLGAGPYIPLAWLAEAAPGYLTTAEWNATGRDWLAHALDYVTRDCAGIPGILTPVKTTTPRNQRKGRTAAGTGPAAVRQGRDTQGPQYQLADYLDQFGRRHRADLIPPIDFWTAAAARAHPGDLYTLGDAARDRGLYRDSAQLHKHATTHGNPHAAGRLVRHLHDLHPADARPARWACAHVAIDDPDAVAHLLAVLRLPGADEQIGTLLARDPAVHAPLDNSDAVANLLGALQRAGADEQFGVLALRAAAYVAFDCAGVVAWWLDMLRAAGAQEQIGTLLARGPAAHVAFGDAGAVAWLLDGLRAAGADEQIGVLLARGPAADVVLDNPYTVAMLLDALREAGADEQIGVLLARDPAARVGLGSPDSVIRLLEALREAGAKEQAGVLASRAAAHVAFDDPYAVVRLLDAMRAAGADGQAGVLLARDPGTYVAFDDPYAVVRLLNSTRKAGMGERLGTLASRAAAHVALDDTNAVASLLEALRAAGAQEQAGVLLARDPAAHVALDDPYAVAALLEALRAAGAQGQAGVLLARDPAAHVTLKGPGPVAWLLKVLRKAGAQEQAGTLASRVAAHVPFDDPYAVAHVLEALREAGAQEQAGVLLARDPAAHVTLKGPGPVAWLLKVLREAGAQEQVGVLLARDPAAHVTLDDPYAVAHVLEALRAAGAREQVGVLLARDPAAHVTLDDPYAVAALLEALREAGQGEQAVALVARLPSVGYFGRFRGTDEGLGQFRFGREPDGSAAALWTWEDLE